jgi:hypothetical protein
VDIVGVLVMVALGVWCCVLAVTNRRIPLLLRLLPVLGWALLVVGAIGGWTPVAAVGGVSLVVGLTVDVLYERVLGGGGKDGPNKSGRHGA